MDTVLIGKHAISTFIFKHAIASASAHLTQMQSTLIIRAQGFEALEGSPPSTKPVRVFQTTTSRLPVCLEN
jgi:hypothetical protein